MSLKIDTNLYSNFLSNGFKEAEKKSKEFAPLIIQLYGNQYLAWLFKKIKIKENFKLVLIETHYLYKDIQKCLKEGTGLQGDFYEKWLHDQHVLLTTQRQEEVIYIEEKKSYAVLAFPFQETYLYKKKNNKRIEHFESLQIRGTELLHKFLEKKMSKSLDAQELFCLQRTLFTHFPLYRKGKWLTWPDLLFEWANTNERNETIQTLFKLFGKSLPYEVLFANQGLKRHQTLNFCAYVIEETISSLEEIMRFSFTSHCKLILRKYFESEKKRLDCLYFMVHYKDSLETLPPSSRLSSGVLDFFKMSLAFLRFHHVEEQDLPYLFECVCTTDLSIEQYYRKHFSKELPKKETNDIIQWLRSKNLDKNALYLIAFFATHPAEFLKVKELSLDFPELSPTQILEYLVRIGLAGLERMQKGGDLNELSSLVELPLNQCTYLVPLLDAEDFQIRLQFLKKIAALIEKKLDAKLTFSFLTSRINISKDQESIFKLLEFLVSCPVEKEREMIIGDICNLLRNYCTNQDDVFFPVQISYLLMEKFGSVQPLPEE